MKSAIYAASFPVISDVVTVYAVDGVFGIDWLTVQMNMVQSWWNDFENFEG